MSRPALAAPRTGPAPPAPGTAPGLGAPVPAAGEGGVSRPFPAGCPDPRASRATTPLRRVTASSAAGGK